MITEPYQTCEQERSVHMQHREVQIQYQWRGTCLRHTVTIISYSHEIDCEMGI